ncbi:tyrosine-type recombinase/integrase [Sphingobacterium siyangense]|uniref:tyrosine-type recombinase/integrase n=1 Tax=Sphingobacterium siyangense TaxID=459529 RepID=UPI001963D702|nr:tyrosine-type recombinase/integrase [Sphingobacterium siyangense]QRY58486.1 tyrosine-type recombinase/integrase [Sphingobacterium siyangense]
MDILEINKKYGFTEPKLSIEKKTNTWYVYVNYYYNGKRHIFKRKEGLNKAYFSVTKDTFTKDDVKNKRISKKEFDHYSKLLDERNNIANEIKETIKKWIATREFDPSSKIFYLVSNELPLLDYYSKYLEHKKKEKRSEGTITQYGSKINLFKIYLESEKLDSIKVNEVTKQLYIDYLQGLKINKATVNESKKDVSSNWYNDLLNFHRMVWNYIIDVKDLDLKHPLKKGISAKDAQDIEIHTAIPTEYIEESFKQLEEYGSEILKLYCEFIFYTMHRGDTLVQLQFKEIDLEAGIIHIPARKIKTKSKVDLKMNPYLVTVIKQYVQDNEVKCDDYLFGYEFVNSVRNQKKRYKLFGSRKSKRDDYTGKFDHFIDIQIPKAYKGNSNLAQIFKKGKNSSYGYKHTGVVFLREEGWTSDQIIELTGHKDKEILKWYERDFKPKLPEFPETIKPNRLNMI